MFSTRSFGRSLALAAGLVTVLLTTIPANAAEWIPGHVGPGGRWIPGHYAAGPGAIVVEPPAGRIAVAPPPHRVWVPGHVGPETGGWIPGHWKVAP